MTRRFEVEAETVAPVFHCCTIQRLGKWGDAGRRMINDTHHGGLPVLIKLKVRRAQCYECGTQGIRERFAFIQPKRHMTWRLADYIAKQTVLVQPSVANTRLTANRKNRRPPVMGSRRQMVG